MFKFISSCKNPREIQYENYLRLSVGSVGTPEDGSEDSYSLPTDAPNICRIAVGGSVGAGLEVVRNDGIIVLRFLQPVPSFVAVDLQIYGPFSPEDVATVPSQNATGLISKELAVPIIPEEAKT